MTHTPRLAVMMLPDLDHFAGDLLERLPDASGWDVRKFPVTGPAFMATALAWAGDPSRDAIWFESCRPPFPAMIAATDFAGRRVIVRVHRIEAAEAPYVADTAWEKVSDIIVVSPDMRQRVLAAAPEIAVTSRLHLVRNGVDTERYVQAAAADPFRIGWCGRMTLRKNPTLALEILARLREADARYHLSLCGMSGEALSQEAFMHLAARLGLLPAIRSEGRIARADMPAWHAANGVLLQTRLHGGLSHAVLEAASSGCDIAVVDHPGAGECWPAEMLFRTVDEAVALIRSARPGRWREYICNTYSLERQIAEVSAILNDTAAPGLTF